MKTMDRVIAVLLAAALAACLCACGTVQQAREPAETPAPTEAVPASESSTDGRVPPASASETEEGSAEEASETTPCPEPVDPEGFADAQNCVGRPAEELFAAVGEPESSQYAASCETDGAEDGMLFYDGFYVWTVRTDEEELVRAVYLDD